MSVCLSGNFLFIFDGQTDGRKNVRLSVWKFWFVLVFSLCDLHSSATVMFSFHMFCSLLPGREWMCCLTRSVLTESRSLAMDTESKLLTGTPVEHMQPPVTVCSEQMHKRPSWTVQQMQCNLCVVPARHLASGQQLLLCWLFPRSVTTSVLWDTEREVREAEGGTGSWWDHEQEPS